MIRRVLAIVGCAIVLEGFDIQVVGFTAPAMLMEWHLTKQALGPTMAAALLGMLAGASGGGWLGDRIGRRPMLIGCTSIFGLATLLTAHSQSLSDVTSLRLIAGLGFGAALSNAAAMIAEWVPPERGIRTVGLVIVGVPAGGILGAALCSWLIPAAGWRAGFLAAGSLPLALALIMLKFLPESPRYLAPRPPTDTRVPATSAFAQLLSPGLRRTTFGLCLAFLSNLAISYALFGWFTLFVTTLRIPADPAVRAALYLNIFGTLGCIAGLRFMTRTRSKTVLLIYVSLGILALVGLIGSMSGRLQQPAQVFPLWLLTCGMSLVAIGCSGTQTGLYGLAATAYPTSCRASGIGVAAACGRAGGLISSLLGGAILSLANGPVVFLTLLAVCFALSGAGILITGVSPPLGPDPDAHGRWRLHR